MRRNHSQKKKGAVAPCSTGSTGSTCYAAFAAYEAYARVMSAQLLQTCAVASQSYLHGAPRDSGASSPRQPHGLAGFGVRRYRLHSVLGTRYTMMRYLVHYVPGI